MADQDKLRWTKLVADFETCDLTQREFAAERGISFSTLRHWIYKLRKDSRPLVTEAASSPGQAPEQVIAKQGSRLVPVRVVGRGRELAGVGLPVRRAAALSSRHGSQIPAGLGCGLVARAHHPEVGPHLHRLDADRHA
jgi:hypothetical protein